MVTRDTETVTFHSDENGKCVIEVKDRDGRSVVEIPIAATVALHDFFMKVSSNESPVPMSVSFDVTTGDVATAGDHL